MSKEDLKADIIFGLLGLAVVGSYGMVGKAGYKKGYKKGFNKGLNVGFEDGVKAIGEALVDHPRLYTNDTGVYAVVAKKIGSAVEDLIMS